MINFAVSYLFPFKSKLSWCWFILGWFHHQQYDCLPSWELRRKTWRSDQSIRHYQYAFCFLSLHWILLATQREKKFGCESCSGKNFNLGFVTRTQYMLVHAESCQICLIQVCHMLSVRAFGYSERKDVWKWILHIGA